MSKPKTSTTPQTSTTTNSTPNPVCGTGLIARLLACAIKTGTKGGWTYRELAELEQRGAAVLHGAGYERIGADRFRPRGVGTKALTVLEALGEYSELVEMARPLAPPLAS